MPSTDIDGSPIVILSKKEAFRVYEYFHTFCRIRSSSELDKLDQGIIKKIMRDLNIRPGETLHDLEKQYDAK